MDFPPKHACIWMFRWSPRAIATFWDCSASYLTGERTSTWGARTPTSILWREPRQNTAVFPVPDWLWTMTSLPEMMGMMARCCTAEGLSNPDYQQLYHSNRFPSGALISASLIRRSGRSWVIHCSRCGFHQRYVAFPSFIPADAVPAQS